MLSKFNNDLGVPTSCDMQPMAGQEEPEVTPISTPLDTDRLHALFSEYEKLVNGQEAPREREGSPEDDEFSCSINPKHARLVFRALLGTLPVSSNEESRSARPRSRRWPLHVGLRI